MKNIIDYLKHCREVLRNPAHKAEQPLHIVYFLMVGYYSGGPYGVVAVACGIVTIFATGPSHD